MANTLNRLFSNVLRIFTILLPFQGFAFMASGLQPVDFTSRVSELAKISSCCYDRQPPVLNFAGLEHRISLHNYDHVHIYRRVDGDLVNYVIAFPGTRYHRYDGLRDVARNFEGAFIHEPPTNPWTGKTSIGKVGRGFHIRTAIAMESLGDGFKAELQNFKNAGKTVEFHITGHSQGGAVGQIFSFYLMDYLKSHDFDLNKFRIHSFSFSTPKFSDRDFGKVYRQAIGEDNLRAFSFDRKFDPFTMVGFGFENSFDSKLPSSKITYCPYVKFEAVSNIPCPQLENHRIDPFIDLMKNIENWPESLACMSQGYESFLPLN